MVKFEPDPRGLKELLKSRQVAAMLQRVAPPLAARIAAATPKGTGGTAASTRVEHPDMSILGDRVRVRITQLAYTGKNRPRGGAAAPLQFGNAATEQRAQFSRGLSGGPAR